MWKKPTEVESLRLHYKGNMENYIENKAAQAESLFKSGYNCAQSVALAFSDYVEKKKKQKRQ